METEVKDKAPILSAYSVKLTEAQEKAVEIVQNISKKTLSGEGTSVGVLTGFAGTGKTTTIKSIAASRHTVILAPTGKAALRVTEATGLPAQTIHKWLYFPEEDQETGDVRFTLRPDSEIECPSSKLIIIDEASMVDKKLWNDIKAAADRLGCSVLCVGDPFQLPPVDNSSKFCLLDETFPADFRIHLSEVMRQALDNPIIRASMMVREGDVKGALQLFPTAVANEIVPLTDWLVHHDGVAICHRNSTRHHINRGVRKLRGYDDELVDGEPLLVLKNCYILNRFNGEIVRFKGWKKRTEEPVPVTDTYRKLPAMETNYGVAKVDGDRAFLVEKAVHGMMDQYSYIALRRGMRIAAKQMGVTQDPENPIPLMQANLGYSLTCHKSQGSEWKYVLVHIDNSVRLHEEEGRRWLYTAVTRAKDKVAIHMEF